jgi:hypothetical protein
MGQPTIEVTPSKVVGASGSTSSIGVCLDPGSQGNSIGSYGARLTWDPAVLHFVGFAGGDAPFDAPVVNTAHADSGLLSFADAAVPGAGSRGRVLEVTFESMADPPATSALDLTLTSLFAGGTFEDLLPQAQVRDATACVADFFYGLRLSGPDQTLLEWTAIGAATSYDVIRGTLALLLQDEAEIHLGAVTCLENDSLDGTTGAGTEPANPDTEAPPPGQGFFYVVRHHGASQESTYGFSSDCSRERVVDAGDCP